MALNPANGYPHTDEYYAEFAGNQNDQSFHFIKDIDAAMRANYAVNIVNIGQNIYPLLYVESTFDGGRYTFLTDENNRYVYQNVGQIYDITKAVAHIPLGIFSIISGYAEYPHLGQWVPALSAYLEQVIRVRDNIDGLVALDGDLKRAIQNILGSSIRYMQRAIENNFFTLKEFSEYSRINGNSILACQQTAANNQVEVMTKVLESWKRMVGIEAWNKMYVVINAIWTLTQENAHELIIKAQMKADLRETHVVVSEAVPDLESAQTLMGRIVGDRIMAELVFDAQANPAFAQDIYSLSTRRDLLSQAVEAVVGDVGRVNAAEGAAVACPHLRA